MCPWDGPGWCIGAELVHNLLFSERPWQLMALECLSSHSLAEWVMDIPEQQFSAGESPKAEVIYLCTQCPAHSSTAWPCMGKHPRLPAWDQLSWASQWLLTRMWAWRNCPKGTKAVVPGSDWEDSCWWFLRWVTEPQPLTSSFPSIWKGGFQNAGVFCISNGWNGHVSEWHGRCLPIESKK